ncbi:MAG: hypothetical protein ACREOJ_00625 [Gemmatimonadaceae bacterium]
MNDARLSELYREVFEARRDMPRASCLSPDQILALVERQGPEDSRLAALDHVASCPECQREFELLRALRKGAPVVRRWYVSSMGLAASVLIAVAAGAYGVRALAHRGDVVRGPGDSGVHLIAPARSSRTLTWNAVPQALSYTVEVLRRDGSLAASHETSDTIFTVLDSVTLDPSGQYVWWVRAHMSDGTERRSAIQPLGPGR